MISLSTNEGVIEVESREHLVDLLGITWGEFWDEVERAATKEGPPPYAVRLVPMDTREGMGS